MRTFTITVTTNGFRTQPFIIPSSLSEVIVPRQLAQGPSGVGRGGESVVQDRESSVTYITCCTSQGLIRTR